MSRHDATTGQHQDARPVYLTLTRPRCPDCGCPRFQAYNVVKIDGDGTDRPDDGRRVRYSHCANCGRNVVITVD